MNWETLHHIADLAGVATIIGLAWKYFLHARNMAKWIVGDHKKVAALWREHGYNAWDGTERRGRRH